MYSTDYLDCVNAGPEDTWKSTGERFLERGKDQGQNMKEELHVMSSLRFGGLVHVSVGLVSELN